MKMQHPRGLYPLFFTEMWERFGYYMVQTILVLYMTHSLGLSDSMSYLLYGTFSSMLYLTPVVGGYLADRYLGFRLAIVIGAVLFVIGYSLMAIRSTQMLFLGMSIVVIACGFFKPNVSSIVGSLYERHDPRRDGGFTIFYMGINLGALMPPLFAGALVNHLGWHAGYLAAALGLVIGLTVFMRYRPLLGDAGRVPSGSPFLTDRKQVYGAFLGLGTLIAIGIMHVLFLFPKITVFVLIASVISILGVIIAMLFRESEAQRRKLIACMILVVISMGFWAIYVQTYTSLMLFADRNMIQTFLGIPINAEFTQFFNPFFIILLSPILSKFYLWLDQRNKNPSTPMKFTLGLFCMGIGFMVLSFALKWFNVGGMTSAGWLCTSYFFQTTGELLLSPIGLAMVTKLAPPRMTGMMMGVWYLSISAGFAIGGSLAIWASVAPATPTIVSSAIYANAFFRYGALALIGGLISWSLVPYVKGLMGPPSDEVKTPKEDV